MIPYYAANPGIRTQSLATLFPFLEGMLLFLLKNDPGSPFTGAAVTKPNTRPPRNRPNRRLNPPTARSHSPAPPPQHTVESPEPFGLLSFLVRITQPGPISGRNHQAAWHHSRYGGKPQPRRTFRYAGSPNEYPNATLFSESRPRANYCWLHGWNNTHPGTTCKVMGQNPAYTHGMKHATGPNGTGGNPRVGV
jgi:hypothetical protein